MKRCFPIVAIALALTIVCVGAPSANAQCDTCATPTVAYQPVQPVTVVAQQRTGWYPGKLLDRLRLRTWGAQAPATATYTTAGYAPYNYGSAYTAGYTPYAANYTSNYAASPYTAGYTPYSASYTPYVTAYAPLQSTTLYRPVALRPVVANSYSPAAGCSDCGVSQAAYTEPAGGCSNCDAGGAVADYTYQDSASYQDSGYQDSGSWADQGAAPDPATPQPSLKPQADPETSYYRGESLASARELEALRNRIEQLEREAEYKSNYSTERKSGYRGESAPERSLLKKPATEEASEDDGWPGLYKPESDGEEAEEESGVNSGYPRWSTPVSDRTARGPSVSVWNAVYSKNAARPSQVSTHRTTSKPLTLAEIDAQGWHAVRRDR